MPQSAYVFPGQGSQSVGMLKDVAEQHVLVKETFDEASAVLGYDLWALVQEDSDNQLGLTEFTQPALLAASIALWRVVCHAGIRPPEYVAGHSLGEYSALVAAGVLQFADAVKLVQKRGQLMQSAVPLGKGGMAAILKLDDDAVVDICKNCSSNIEIVQAANFNTPGQVVIAGDNAALEKAIVAVKKAGGRAMALSVSAPFHSELMRPAAEKMFDELTAVNFNVPSIAVIQNVNADLVSKPDELRTNLVAQMYSAVLWTATVRKFVDLEVGLIVECGPGKVLTGMTKRIDKSIQSLAVNNSDSLLKALEELK
ncbi:MAG: ACP S-malonyltransferase [Pseudomonadales bacterium]|nr:ACP S-malonyltransferase [Pseudomonadales bacterium]